jgi:hypothetical protein
MSHPVTRGGESRLTRRRQGAFCRFAHRREIDIGNSRARNWRPARRKYSCELAEAGRAKTTDLIVAKFVQIIQVQQSEDLYGHDTKHVADHLLKAVARSSDRVALVT